MCLSAVVLPPPRPSNLKIEISNHFHPPYLERLEQNLFTFLINSNIDFGLDTHYTLHSFRGRTNATTSHLYM